MNSIGHQAKAAVVAAREAGADLPKNAQGLAASGLAHGADAEALFASLIISDTPLDDAPGPDAPSGGENIASEEANDVVVRPSEAVGEEMTEELAQPSSSSAAEAGLGTLAEDIALTLLEEAADGA